MDDDKSKKKDELKRKARAALGSRWALYGASILLVIVSLFGAYYFLYTSDRAVLLDQYYLRLLSNSVGGVQDIVEGRRANVAIATRGFVGELKDSTEDEPDVEAAGGALLAKLALIESVDVDRSVGTDHFRKLFGLVTDEGPSATGSLDLSPELRQRLDSEVGATLQQEDGDAVLVYEPRLTQGANTFELTVAKAELAKMIAPALPDEVFGTVLLARANGDVLLQSGNSQYRLRELPRSSRRADEDGAALEDPDPSSRTHIRRVDIAGVSYKLFVQPFRVPIAVDNGIDVQVEGQPPVDALERSWVLAGLMPVAALRTESMVISPNLVLIVVGLFVAGMLGLPYLKIRFLGHREALRAQDVLVLAVAILVGTSLYTYAIVDTFTFSHLQRQRGDQLKSLATGIEREAQRELACAGAQLGALTQERSDGLKSMPAGTAKWWPRANLFAGGGQLPGYPYFQMVFWLDGEGGQVGKWGPAGVITAKIRVPTRDYFLRPHHGELWKLDAECAEVAGGESTTLADGLFVQSIRSKTTGDVSAVLARKVSKPGAGDPAAVAAIETHLLTLIDPVLPAGFGFAVFADDGTVLFHSDKARNLHENFLEEIEQDEVLRAAIFSGADERVTTTYRTRPVDVFVTKMDSLPWHLAVFADADRLRTRHLEALTFALMLFTIYLAVILAVGVWLRFTDRVRPSPGAVRSNWFWPDAQKLFPYSVLTLAMGWLIVCWTGGAVLGDPIADIGRTVFTSVVGMTLIHWVLRTHHLWAQGIDQWKRSLRIVSKTAALGVGVVAIDRGLNLFGLLSVEVLMGVALLVVLVLRRGAPLLGLLGAIAIGMVVGSGGDRGDLWTGLGVLIQLASVLYLPWPRYKGVTEKMMKRLGAGWKGVYVACAFSVMIVLGVLPALTFYRVTHNDVSFLFAKHEQVEFANALRERADRLAARYSTLNTAHPLPLLERHAGDLGEQLHVYAGRDFEGGDGSWLAATESPDDAAWVNRVASRQELVEDLRPFLPQYNETTYRLRDLYAAELETGARSVRSWAYGRPAGSSDEGERRLRMVQSDYRSALDLGLKWRTATREPGDSVDLELSSPVATLDRRFVFGAMNSSAATYAFWFLVAAFALLVLWCVIRSSVERVFLVDTLHPRVLRKRLVENERARARTLVLQPDEEMAEKLFDETRCFVIDSLTIREAETARELVNRAVDSGLPTIVVRRFDDGLDEPSFAMKKLQLLEELHQVGDQNVVVTSAVDPLDYFTGRATDSLASTLLHEVDRWAVVFEPFEKVRGDAHEASPVARREEYRAALVHSAKRDLSQEVQEVLTAECWANPYQRALGLRIAPRIETRDRDQIVDLVLDHSEAYYRRLWSSCSTEERLLLNRLAQEGFVNWQMDESLRRMLRRGLVVGTPAFRLMNESFRRFALRAETHTVFAAWEMQGEVGLFARLKVPIITALVVLAGFFFATQRESFNHTLGIVTAMATSGPLLVKLMTATAAARQKG